MKSSSASAASPPSSAEPQRWDSRSTQWGLPHHNDHLQFCFLRGQPLAVLEAHVLQAQHGIGRTAM